jgi:hypothetical protein
LLLLLLEAREPAGEADVEAGELQARVSKRSRELGLTGDERVVCGLRLRKDLRRNRATIDGELDADVAEIFRDEREPHVRRCAVDTEERSLENLVDDVVRIDRLL